MVPIFSPCITGMRERAAAEISYVHTAVTHGNFPARLNSE